VIVECYPISSPTQRPNSEFSSQLYNHPLAIGWTSCLWGNHRAIFYPICRGYSYSLSKNAWYHTYRVFVIKWLNSKWLFTLRPVLSPPGQEPQILCVGGQKIIWTHHWWRLIRDYPGRLIRLRRRCHALCNLSSVSPAEVFSVDPCHYQKLR